jgi:hypothetical protein
MKENTHLTAITRNEAERLLRHVRSGRIRIHGFNPNYLSDLRLLRCRLCRAPAAE